VQVFGSRYGAVDLRDLRRRIGWVTVNLGEQVMAHHGDDPALWVVASGRDASIGLYRRLDSAAWDEAETLLTWIGGQSLRDRPFRVLSQGERQRVLLARAWMSHPRLLMLDEPASGLDLVARERFLEGLSRLVEEAADAPAVIYVTHHIDEILPWFTHAMVLSEGRITGLGRKEETLTDPVLSRAFGVAVEVVWRSGRPWLTLA
jgi:iron complex transport system ATP-binding protein